MFYRCKKLDGIFEICFSGTYGYTSGFHCLIWKLCLKPGMVNGIFDQFGIQAVDFMNSVSPILGSWWASLYGRTLYDIVLCLAGPFHYPYNLCEAAKVDGGELAVFF